MLIILVFVLYGVDIKYYKILLNDNVCSWKFINGEFY